MQLREKCQDKPPACYHRLIQRDLNIWENEGIYSNKSSGGKMKGEVRKEDEPQARVQHSLAAI